MVVILCIDVGNSHFYGGVFAKDRLLLKFRHHSRAVTSDEIGIFLKNVLRENQVQPEQIKQIAICSVVPSVDYSLRAACLKYFAIEPFIVQAGIKTGLKINYRNPLEVGADRIANAIASIHKYPEHNLIVIDFGTATTFCAISSDKHYLGGVILPGLRLSMETLQQNAAKLPPVEIIHPRTCIGRSTVDSIQSGLYFSAVGSCREIVSRIKEEAFSSQATTVIATGGFAGLLEPANLFDVLEPDLVLDGLRIALHMNLSHF